MIFWTTILTKLQQNKKVMLLMIVSHRGSSPGKQGFKMMVSDDGELNGSIGGGRCEYLMVEKARRAFNENDCNPEILRQVHRTNSTESSGMICAGEQTVAFYPLNGDHIDAVQKIVDQENGVLIISNKEFRWNAEIEQENKFLFTRNEDEWIYSELINYKPKIFIVGGGHVGLATARIFETLDFEVTMLENRHEINTFEDNVYSHGKHIIDYERIADFIPSGAQTYVAIMTHGYVFDRMVLSKLIENEYKYIGVLGSKAKIRIMFDQMEKAGIEKSRLEKVHAPIGISINSRTPAEIAVSVAAEIIAHKNKRQHKN